MESQSYVAVSFNRFNRRTGEFFAYCIPHDVRHPRG